MAIRTTETTITVGPPSTLTSRDRPQPTGSHGLVTDGEEILGHLSPACQRRSAMSTDERRLRFHGSKGLIMHYIGGISGHGVLMCNGEHIARTSYDFDGFFTEPVGVTCCGEIQLSAAALKDVFGRSGVQLLTDEGNLLDLTFSEKVLLSASDVAHVDVKGELPATPLSWHK